MITRLLPLTNYVSGAENETQWALLGHTNGNIEMRSPSAAAMLTMVAVQPSCGSSQWRALYRKIWGIVSRALWHLVEGSVRVLYWRPKELCGGHAGVVSKALRYCGEGIEALSRGHWCILSKAQCYCAEGTEVLCEGHCIEGAGVLYRGHWGIVLGALGILLRALKHCVEGTIILCWCVAWGALWLFFKRIFSK